MKTWIFCAMLLAGCGLRAATTIDATNRFAYGANLGWTDWRGETNLGAVIGEYVCSGFLYAGNVGWINLGSGAPTNGIQYQNNFSTDFGVNFDSMGNLRGYAYGANIGWLAFETNGAPKVDLTTGRFSGSAYSANCGWISLSNAVAVVKTTSIAPGTDSDRDGLPDAFELQYFHGLGISANADADGDGQSNLQEYFAGTNPTNAVDFLRITSVARPDWLRGFTMLQWTSVPSRSYALQARTTLDSMGGWSDAGYYGFGANAATFSTGNTTSSEFYRVRAFRPLGP